MIPKIVLYWNEPVRQVSAPRPRAVPPRAVPPRAAPPCRAPSQRRRSVAPWETRTVRNGP
jgi:hypothetical protein